MYNRLTNKLLKLDSWVYELKKKIAVEAHGKDIVLWGGQIIFAELVLMVTSFFLGFFLTQKTLKNQGASDEQLTTYALRWKLTLGALLGGLGVLLLKSFFGIVISSYIFPVTRVDAASSSWNFDNPTGFIYDSAVVQIVDGMAVFKAVEASKQSETPVATPLPEQSSDLQSLPPVITPPTLPVETTPAPSATPEPAMPTPTVAPTPEPATPAPSNPPADAPASEPETSQQSLWQLFAPTAYAQGKKCEATIQPTSSIVVNDLKRWTGFIETAQKTGGEIYYQLSDNDGSSWQYWQANQWRNAASTKQYNTATEVNAAITNFPTANKKILFRAFLVSDCINQIKLMDINITHEKNTTTTPTPSSTPTPSLTPSPSASPTPSITASPSATPTPSATVTATPSSSPTPVATIEPTPTATATPSPTTTPSPTATPTPSPTTTPSPTPEPLFNQLTTSIWLLPATQNPTLAQEANIFSYTYTAPATIEYQLQGTGTNQSLTVAGQLSDDGTLGQYLVTAVYTGSELQLFSNGNLIGATTGSLNLSDDIDELVQTPQPNYSIVTTALNQSQIALQYLQNRNTAPIMQSIQALQTNQTLLISYLVRDEEGDYVELDQYDYSLTGEFTSEEKPFTFVSSDPQHQGIHSLAANDTGVSHTLVADISQDPSIVGQTIFLRLRAKDSLSSGQALTRSIALTAPVTEPPDEETPDDTPTETLPSPSPTVTPTATQTAETVATAAAIAAPTIPPSASPTSTPATQTLSLPTTTVDIPLEPTTGGPIATVRDISIARESTIVPIPSVDSVGEVLGSQTLNISGKGIPNSEIMLYIFSNQAVLHRTTVDADGNWEYSHNQAVTPLEPGSHSVYAQTLLADEEIKSKPSAGYSFNLEKRWWVTWLQFVDLPTTLLTVFMAGIGIVMLQSKREVKKNKSQPQVTVENL